MDSTLSIGSSRQHRARNLCNGLFHKIGKWKVKEYGFMALHWGRYPKKVCHYQRFIYVNCMKQVGQVDSTSRCANFSDLVMKK